MGRDLFTLSPVVPLSMETMRGGPGCPVSSYGYLSRARVSNWGEGPTLTPVDASMTISIFMSVATPKVLHIKKGSMDAT